MKKTSSSVTARATLGAIFFMFGILLVVFAFSATRSDSATRHKNAAVQAPIVALPAPPPDNGPKLGFENFEGPGILTNVTTSSQGQPVNTVEYIAHDAGEPSIGVNWNSPAPNNVNGVT